MKLVRSQLEDTALGPGRNSGEEREFLAELLAARRQIWYHLVVGVDVLYKPTSE